jgi:hypothetical protein
LDRHNVQQYRQVAAPHFGALLPSDRPFRAPLTHKAPETEKPEKMPRVAKGA